MKIPGLLAIFLLLSLSASAQNFSDYPVKERFSGKNARVIITKDDRLYRTRLREISREKVNFAGHYIASMIGCGAECVLPVIINAKTGKVMSIAFSLCCWFDPQRADETRDLNSMEFYPDSSLIVFRGMKNEEEPTKVFYYKVQDDRLVFIKSRKL